ncbi:MAG: glycosyltransferase family 1 protein [Lachnospiraceae bacterium]|nr:glycosyltransferase family 1 protein [Lachnospiraceae bacterium]
MTQLGKILVIKGIGQYLVLETFVDVLVEAFKESFVQVDVFSCTDNPTKDDSERNNYCSLNNYDMIFAFNGMFMEQALNRLIKKGNALYWDFLVDHPCYHSKRLYGKCTNHYVSCVDANHVSFIKRYFPNIDYTGFLPHGGNMPEQEVKPLKDREYQVVFLGSYGGQEIEQKIAGLSTEMKKIVEKIMDRLLFNNVDTIEGLLQEEFRCRDFHVSDIEFVNLMDELGFIEEYIHGKHRQMLIEALAEKGIAIDIFGNGWEDYISEHPECVRIHGAVNYKMAIEIMGNARVVINKLPLFRDGSHERVFTSMLCGAVCVSDRNNYLEREFHDGEDIVFYDMSNLEEFSGRMRKMLSNLLLMEKIAWKGKSIAEKKHTWRCRAREIVKEAERIFSNHVEEKYLSMKNLDDYKFNSLINYLNQASMKKIVDKMVYIYEFYNRTHFLYHDELMKSQVTRGKWEEDDYTGEKYFSYVANILKNNWEIIVWLYQELEDYSSRKVLLGILENRLFLDYDKFAELVDRRFGKFLDKDILEFYQKGVLIDFRPGAGELIDIFIQETKNNYSAIFIYVVDEKIEKEYLSNKYRLFSGITIHQLSSDKWRGESIGGKIGGKATILKIDALGMENEIILGCREEIIKEKPQIMVALEYRLENLWKTAKILKSLVPDYKLYLRYYGGNLFPNGYVLYVK